jgi:NADP-dependent 3-hydroxy-3-methylglutaryl-CoA reductase
MTARNTRGDERKSRRFHFPADSLPSVKLERDGSRWQAQLNDLSEDGALVRIQGDGPTVRSQVDLILTDFEALGIAPLHGLDVRSVTTAADGSSAVVVTTEDEANRATLWQLVELLSIGAAAAAGQIGRDEVPRIPGRGTYSEASRKDRLNFLRKSSGTALTALDETRLDAERLSSNIENMIGAVEIPVGIGGPLLFRGQEARGMVYAPMATTEGALVASVTRGATAITRAGGCITRVLGQRMMRVPVFVLSSLNGAVVFAQWIREHVDKIREQIQQVTRHGKLMSVDPVITGNTVNLYFLYETGDAAGQNMTTACTWHACQWIVRQMKFFREIEIRDFILEGNMSGDKKVTYSSFLNGRGTRVVAEAFIPGDIVEDVLKIDPKALVKGIARAQVGGIAVGMVGFTINAANVIGAMFTALGQDIACVHESSVAQLHAELVDDGVYASMVLPALIVGSVGGGTHLPAQRALLESIGCVGAGKSQRLAEIIAGFCLALDLSTAAAMGSGQFAHAHDRLGRNRPVEWFSKKDLTPAFFEAPLQKSLGDAALKVSAVTPITMTMGSSIIAEISSRNMEKQVGFFPMRAHYTSASGEDSHVDLVLKSKPLDQEIIMLANRMAQMCGPRVAAAHEKAKTRTGFLGCHQRELAIFRQTDPRFTAHAPKAYIVFEDAKREAYVLGLEKLDSMLLMDSVDSPEKWTRADVRTVLDGAAELHAIWLGKESDLVGQPWIGEVPSTKQRTELRELWDSLIVQASSEFPELINLEQADVVRGFIKTTHEWWPELETMPRTLCHNDFNPRNLALRADESGTRLCAYDWELATLHVPQHDVAEFLSYVLPDDFDADLLWEHVEYARKALEKSTGAPVDAATWRRGFQLSLRDLALDRFAQLTMAHMFKQYGFLEHAMQNLLRMIGFAEGAAS